jgi:eukaryotic-like serine/threonine-protein kinase
MGMLGGSDRTVPNGIEEPPDPLVGQLIRARYRVGAKLAVGQTGTVYVAQQLNTGNKVALKILHGALATTEEAVGRFRQLMTAIRALSRNHGSIVMVHDFDQAEDGRLFVAMELLAGTPLSEVIRQAGPLDIEKALRLARQMAEGLGVAHEFGIVHRDIRPQHFMIVGKEETVKVFGFERARLKDGGGVDLPVDSEGLPRAPAYLAPEQIRGEELTRQADIYAFGVVLYEMLSGVLPFRGSTPDAVREMHLRDAPPPLRELRPEIPAVVEAKVLQALEKDPKLRETYVNDVVNEYLYDSALLEMGEKQGQAKAARVRPTQPATASDVDEEPSDVPGPTRAHWKLILIGGALLLIAAISLWIFSSRQVPEDAAVPVPQPSPGEARPPAPAAPEKSDEGAREVASPPPQELTPPESPKPEATPPEERKPRVKQSPPAPKKERPASRQKSPPPAAAQGEVPSRKADSPDPGDVIDWLLKRPPAAKE